MALTIESCVTLRSSLAKMPVLGFGVYQSRDAYASTTAALHAGYSHIDTARVYKRDLAATGLGSSESVVAQAVHDFAERQQRRGGGAPRRTFLTTKVNAREHGLDKARLAIDDSIRRADEHGQNWDLYLLHDPMAGPERRLEAWRALEEAVKQGRLSAIGVSNFSEKHLELLKQAGVEIMPEVNQVELHPWCQQKPIVEYCRREQIQIQAYCPLVRGEARRMSDPVLTALSERLGRTPAQVLVRWSLQHGFVPLPKSDTPARITENAHVFDFELSADDMQRLDALDEGDSGACSWNPINVA